MSNEANLAIDVTKSNKIVPISIVALKEDFNKFYASFLSASWDNQVLYVANYLSLPLSNCITESGLTLLEDSKGASLGHKSIYDFVASAPEDMGLGLDWNDWSYQAKAMIKKLEFGINAVSAKDVFLQIGDVKSRLGREPVSKFEFNLAKDQIIKEQLLKIQREHSDTVTSMNSKLSSLMTQLEDERKEKLNAIERLEGALSELSSLKSKSDVDLKDYIEVSIYNKIVEEMDELSSNHESLLQGYLDKISKLTITNKEHISKIEQLKGIIRRRNDEIEQMSLGSVTYDEQAKIAHENEVMELKEKIVALLKKNIHKQKVINKQFEISNKKSQISALLKERNRRLEGKLRQSEGNTPRRLAKKKLKITNTKLFIAGGMISSAILAFLYSPLL
jgi:hypothetical protein